MNNNSILVLSSDADFIAALREFLPDTNIVDESSVNSGFHYCAILDFTTVKIDEALVYELKRKAHFIIFLVNDFVELSEEFAALASDIWQKPIPNQILKKRFELLRYAYHNLLVLYSLVFDMKNPLVSIQGYADVLFSGLMGELSEQQHNAVGVIRHSAYRLQHKLHNFRDWQKIARNELEISLEILPVDNFRAELVRLKEAYEKAYSKPISLQITENFPRIMADSWHLSRVIEIIFSNALGRIYSSLEFSLYERGNELVFSFSVKATDIATDLEAFFTGGWEEYVLAKYIIEAHGGRIWLESEEAKGTSVYFTLPVAKDSLQ